MGDANLLAVSLCELEQTGWNLDDYLTTRKDLSDSVILGLLAANRIRREPRPVPSDEFRRRARSSFVSLVQEQAVSRLTSSPPTLLHRIRRLLIGPVLGPVAAVVLATSGGGIGLASEGSLPGSPLYPAKVGIERLEQLAAVTPAEQAQVRLSIATTRLVEADTELKDGNVTGASVLLGQVDAEIEAAHGIVAAHGLENSGPVNVERQIASISTTRDSVLAGVETRPLVAESRDRPSRNVSDPAKLGEVTSPSIEPNVSPKLVTAVVERVERLSPPTTVAASASRTQPPEVEKTTGAASSERSIRLSRLLIVEVQAGDGASAFATARDFADAVHELAVSETGGREVLRQERSSLAACLPIATSSTRDALQVALSSIDSVLGAVASESHSDSTSKIPTKERISIDPAATPASGSSEDGSRSKKKTASPTGNVAGADRSSIPLPGFLGIANVLGPPPVAPTVSISPKEARLSGHEANGGPPVEWFPAWTNTFELPQASSLATKRPLSHNDSRRMHLKPHRKVAKAHGPPKRPAEHLTGVLKVIRPGISRATQSMAGPAKLSVVQAPVVRLFDPILRV